MKKGVISILSAAAGAIAGAVAIGKTTSKAISEKQQYADKHLALFLLMNQWVKVKQEGKSLDTYFKENKYKKIAIYGLGYAGETLISELKDSGIEVLYGIDQNAAGIYSEVEVYSMNDELPEVDAVVVSAIFFFDEIEEKLNEKFSCPIISLEDILYEV